MACRGVAKENKKKITSTSERTVNEEGGREGGMTVEGLERVSVKNND
jgi:hypothetical protein